MLDYVPYSTNLRQYKNISAFPVYLHNPRITPKLV